MLAAPIQYRPDLSQIVPNRAMVPREAAVAFGRATQSREMSIDEIKAKHFAWSRGSSFAGHADAVADLDRYLDGMHGRVAMFELGVETATETFYLIEYLRRTTCLDVRPMFRLARFNHYGGLPGDEPEVVDPSSAAAAQYTRPAGVTSDQPALPVYVIDSGYAPNHAWAPNPDFNSTRIEPLRPCDLALATGAKSASHGTFVACVIAAISPNSEVRVLAVDLDKVGTHEPHKGDENKADAEETSIASAINRVIEDVGETPALLNMSFGAYPLFMRNESGAYEEVRPLELELAMRRLVLRTNVKPLAAGGNQFPHDTEPFVLPYPAGFKGVVDVGALDREDRWVLWDESAVMQLANAMWTGAPGSYAPGVKLWAPGGPELVQWSGSSFAVAVQTGVWARTGELAPYGQLKVATWADYPYHA